jgi:hypothetical protein
MDKTPLQLEEEFYSNKFFLSYSGLNKLLYAPNLFYKHYVLQQREEKPESYLVEGKVIHALMLGNFEQDFIVSQANLPTDSVKSVIDKVYAWYKANDQKGILTDYDEQVLKVLKEVNLYQSLVDDKKAGGQTGDEKRLSKVLTGDSVSYFNFLCEKGTRILIDQETLEKCKVGSEALMANTEAYRLMGFDSDMRNIEVKNEIAIKTSLSGLYPFGFKGIVDNLVIDHDTKTVYINDLKTSGKTLADFRETLEFYNYWLQAAIYDFMIRDRFRQVPGDWKFVFTFIVVDKYNQTYCFQVSESTMMEWGIKLVEKANEFKYHYEERSYSLPYAFLQDKILL